MNEAFLAHELRRPLTLLKGYAELLDQNSEVVQKLGRVADELNDVLEAFLRLHKPRMERVNWAELAGCAGEVWVRGDRVLLSLVVQNLLENARRYGVPPIAVEVVAKEEAWLMVADRGSGRAVGQSWGLGLELVKEIAAAHGGRLEVRGARFSVVLPLAGRGAESIRPATATALAYGSAASTPRAPG